MGRILTADPFAPAQLGPVTLRNRIIKAATFEGMTPGNVPTPQLTDYHLAVARGGVGMTTVAFSAVSRDARGAPGELVLSNEAMAGLRDLTSAVHETGSKVSVQLGHAGPVASAAGYRGWSPSPYFSPVTFRRTKALDDADIERVTADFVTAAGRAVDAGVDAIEVHLGHHYLLSAFLSPRLNRRTDEWGGSVERRAAFPRQVVRSIRAAVGTNLAVTAKLNMVDGVKNGLTIDQSIETAKLLESDGCLDAVQLTGGGSLLNPMYLFRGDAPVSEMAQIVKPWMRPAFKLVGKRFFKTYPFEEAFFREYALRFRAELKMPLILLGGINERATIDRAMDDGFEFVAMARALLKEPDLV
ncbi:MAG TPA: NADH:flavin oxidoreductase, partial [Acidimicrobiales bacterium]|nr:NADH:flavin oxidoreductase [Acidimicrobiales bacterium]